MRLVESQTLHRTLGAPHPTPGPRVAFRCKVGSQEIVWSFKTIFTGLHPICDSSGVPFPQGSPQQARAGQPLAGGFRGVLWTIRGDLDFFANALHLEHFHSNRPCFLCKADWEGVPWTDPRPQAAWRSTVYTKEAWKDQIETRVDHSLTVLLTPKLWLWSAATEIGQPVGERSPPPGSRPFRLPGPPNTATQLFIFALELVTN